MVIFFYYVAIFINSAAAFIGVYELAFVIYLLLVLSANPLNRIVLLNHFQVI